MATSTLIIVIVSVVGGLLYAAYEQWVKLQVSKNASNVDEKTQQTIDELKQRIEVLEKIVTDEKYSLKSEINALDKAS